jgi:hypothetical protein
LTIATFSIVSDIRISNSGVISIPLVAGILYTMIGIPMAAPMLA